MKKSFILKNNWIGIFDRLSDKQAGALIKMLYDYNVNGNVEIGANAGMNDEVVNAYFNMMILDCNDFKERYDRRCETSANNGNKGGAPKGNQNAKKDILKNNPQNNQKQLKQPKNNLTDFKPLKNKDKNNLKQPKQPKQPDNENENENENEIISSDEAIIYTPLPLKSKKIDFAEFVSMTNDEYSSLVAKLGSEEGVRGCIEILDNYKGSSGKKYKSDYRAILNWVIDKFNEKKSNQNATNQRVNRTGSQRPTPAELSAAVKIGIAIAEADKNRKWD